MSSEECLRRFLLILSAIVLLGTIAELLLLEHFDEPLQLVPFVMAAAGLAVLVGVLTSGSRGLLRALRVVMILTAITGVVGVILHLKGNIEFELEIQPGRSVGDVFWKSLRGGSPLLAPGTLILVAALGWAATYHFEKRTD